MSSADHSAVARPSDHALSNHAVSGAAPSVHVDGAARIGDARLFGPLSLRFEAGRWTALLGRSGRGKTSILRAIAGALTPPDFTGTVASGDGAPLAGRLAYMAQNDLLLPWADALENVALGARLRGEPLARREAMARLEAVGLADKATARPDQLSGGQRQRVALARTLFEDRPVALLDEPFSALDAATRAELQDLAWTRLAGRTVILVTHDPLEAARMAHRAILLGEIGAPPQTIELPSAPPPRDPGHAETLAAAALLTRRLQATP